MPRKNKALSMAGFGAASVQQQCWLLFKVTMAFLVGVGSIFILVLCSIRPGFFQEVAVLLHRHPILDVDAVVVLKLSTKVAKALRVSKSINRILAPIPEASESLSSQALQQGVIGLLLTALIVTMPIAAATLRQGNMVRFDI
jgi:type IV secretion system protein VirB6